MSVRERRVRSVRLRAPDAAVARRGALLLEDALHTATLPGAEGGRLLLVRSLDVGRIDPDGSPASLALAIEERFRHLKIRAVHAADPGAPGQPVVYFADRAEALVLLAARLARGGSADAWFWPVAVPGWSTGLPPGRALRSILAWAAESPAGVHAVVELVRDLEARGALDALLATLTPADGPSLLRPLGPPRSNPPDGGALAAGAAVEEPAPPGQLATSLARFVPRWGPDDDRSIWLAAMALLAERPGRAADPRLLARARRLAGRSRVEGMLSRPAPRTAASPPPGTAAREEGEAGVAAAARPDSPASTVDPGDPMRSGAAPAPLPAGDAPGDSWAEAVGDGAHPHQATLAGEVRKGPEQIPGVASIAESPTALPPGPDAGDAPAPEPPDVADPAAQAGARTAGAGLFFLLPALVRLGVAEILAADPDLLEADVPARVLLRAAARVGLPPEDPCVAFLLPTPPDPGSLRFVAPAAWRRGIVARGPATLRRIAGRPAARLLSDATGRLPLALWRRGAAGRVRALLAGDPLRRGDVVGATADAELVAEAILSAARRWLRRSAGIGLHDLIRRPGRLLVTRTHLDVFLDHALADIRVRRSGLDLDPGWLPWLGRVVSFHYLHGETGDG